MQTVGLTHLTAVSGANCSLILGALLLAARSLRLARLPAAAVALAGLGLFVLMVGPDASVLRASLMGAIALASLASGRAGRGLSFLCLAVIGLLLLAPGLGTSFGFLLSVLATLGIIVLGRQIVAWIPRAIPRWMAAGAAVPLSAQLMCGPVIVMLQPQFATYSLFANVLAAPLVAPVTILGTAAVPLVPLLPWLATALIGVAGLFAAGVAGITRFMAGLPGRGPAVARRPVRLDHVLFSVLNVLLVWLAVRPARTLRLVFAAHGAIATWSASDQPAARAIPAPQACRARLGAAGAPWQAWSLQYVPREEPRVAAAQTQPSRTTATNSATWRDVTPAAVVLVTGPEEYLGIRAMDHVRSQVRTAAPDVEVTPVTPGTMRPGRWR